MFTVISPYRLNAIALSPSLFTFVHCSVQCHHKRKKKKVADSALGANLPQAEESGTEQTK